jgi:hypothetical protein
VETEYPISAKISARKCPTCGHHEVGYVTADGVFHSLKPGDTIKIFQGGARSDSPGNTVGTKPGVQVQRQTDQEKTVAWIPDPVKHDKELRLKFGVLVGTWMIQNGMAGGAYELAYRQKLQDLIEREIYVPLPVILDRYFNSPHLAAGTSKEIADALFEELDEVKEPVSRMKTWLDKTDDHSLKKLIHPKTPEALEQGPFNADEFKQELDSLTLEEFFDLL